MQKCPKHDRELRSWENVCPECDLEIDLPGTLTDREDDAILAAKEGIPR